MALEEGSEIHGCQSVDAIIVLPGQNFHTEDRV